MGEHVVNPNQHYQHEHRRGRVEAARAAWQLGISEADFLRGVNSGAYPKPINGANMWAESDIAKAVHKINAGKP